jgi:hypothetical protein
MRIHGRGSRRSPQKSLRLYADPEYGKEYFEYPFFRQKPALGRFKVLLLRTTGGTLGPLFKEELCNYLVQDMHTDYPAGETAILFINGEYWGIYNLMERQNRYFIEDNFQVSDTDVDIVAYDREVIAEEGTLDEYNQLVMQLQNADPASEGFYREMEGRMDLNNLIDYYIAQLYFANTDWPLSNVELWKLKNDTAKWRYFFFDSDASMVWLNEDHLTEYNNDIEELQRYPEFCTVILKTLMNNDLFRTRFFRKYHDHMNTTFSTDRVWEAIDRFERKYAPLVPEHIYRWHNPADYAKWEEHVDWLRSFALQRPLYIAEQLLRNFGKPFIIYPNPGRGDFTVELVVPAESVTIRVLAVSGELLGYRTFTNVQGTSVPVSIGLPPGLYVLQVITNDLLYSDKLVIQ